MYGPCAFSSLSSAFLIVYDVVPAFPAVGVITTSSFCHIFCVLSSGAVFSLGENASSLVASSNANWPAINSGVSAFSVLVVVFPALSSTTICTLYSVPSGKFVNSTSCVLFPFTTIGAISFPSLSVAGFPFSSSSVYVIVLIPLSVSVAFASTVIEFVVSSTSGVDVGAVLSTSNVCVAVTVFVPSVVVVSTVYVPVDSVWPGVAGISMWYVPSFASNATSVPSTYVVLFPAGSVTFIVVVPPVVAGSTVTTTFSLFIIPVSGVIFSPVALSLWIVVVAFWICCVLIVAVFDSVYPFPSLSFTLVFTG